MSSASSPIALRATAAWRRRHPEVAKLEQLAALDFQPAADVAEINAETFLAAARLHAPAVAVAASLAGRTKEDLVRLVRRAGARADDSEEGMALMLIDARSAFEATLALLDDAAARLKVALAAVAVELPANACEPGD